MSRWISKDGRRSFIHDALVLVGNQFAVMAIGAISGMGGE